MLFIRFFTYLQSHISKSIKTNGMEKSCPSNEPFSMKELDVTERNILKFVQLNSYKSEIALLESDDRGQVNHRLPRSNSIHNLNLVVLDSLLWRVVVKLTLQMV